MCPRPEGAGLKSRGANLWGHSFRGQETPTLRRAAPLTRRALPDRPGAQTDPHGFSGLVFVEPPCLRFGEEEAFLKSTTVNFSKYSLRDAGDKGPQPTPAHPAASLARPRTQSAGQRWAGSGRPGLPAAGHRWGWRVPTRNRTHHRRRTVSSSLDDCPLEPGWDLRPSQARRPVPDEMRAVRSWPGRRRQPGRENHGPEGGRTTWANGPGRGQRVEGRGPGRDRPVVGSEGCGLREMRLLLSL